jgi:hypothetical protein
MEQNDVMNGFAALINGFRSGQQQASQGQMAEREQTLKERMMGMQGQAADREQAFKEQQMAMEQQRLGTQDKYYNSLISKNENDIGTQIRELKLKKEFYKKTEKEKKDRISFYAKRDTDLMNNISSLVGKAASLMNDPDQLVKVQTTIEELKREREENKRNAAMYGIDLFGPQYSQPAPGVPKVGSPIVNPMVAPPAQSGASSVFSDIFEGF